MDSTVSRRSVLVAGVAGAGVAALAACSPGGGGGTAAQTSQSAGQELTALDKVPVGQGVAVQLPDGSAGIVSRPTTTTAACFSAICTHLGCTVVPAGTQLQCPCHGSAYNAVTGAVINGPATRPLAQIAVHVANGAVLTGA
ncbi:MAG TPA: Rieske (2Fe-2S) protein [Jatrophihabitantaceae bacterium]|jgi:Rieske Fe-S protein|nr:Rieske (2Fe-2S) protein [Jatrophihabitantaceae bacterium]